MHLGLILGLLLATETPLPAAGQATWYNPGVFEAVWENRQATMAPCPECLGFVAMFEPGDLGRRVWITYQGETRGPYLVIDCAASQHRAGLRAKGWLIDLPYELAQRWRLAGPVIVSVADRAPAPAGVHRARGAGALE